MEVTGKTRKPPPWNHCDLQDNCAKLSHAGADTDGHARVRVSPMMVNIKTNHSVREERETQMPAEMLGIGKHGSKYTCLYTWMRDSQIICLVHTFSQVSTYIYA